MKKSKVIGSFRVNEEAGEMFEEASKELGIQKPQLSRLLFNRALKELFEAKRKAGSWNKIIISIKEIL